ncbi:unnamed protein product [Parascedosporium putredinis]|uniref:Class II aldolase/adducin N-terminal domain-containing protein n=1 Tax=Parascedosporium putredinis TaxID=1442378 RepID=A0A9P1GXH2_9PEZI|nr:unnamed protein product [Parascedosporium putredinis]CAI7989679.1 unnamed protein product [Parascedosporium putredinis]
MAPAAETPEHTIEGDEGVSVVASGLASIGPPTFKDPKEEQQYLKGRLALAFRIFAKLGFDEGVAGHITVRDPIEPTSFWVNPFGVAWPLLKASDLIRVNAEGKVVEGGPVRLLNNAAYMIHHAVHTARPEVNCVAHSHSIHGRAFAALDRPLDIITQDSCAFYNDLALYSSFGGIVLGEEEGLRIAFWFMSLETCCRVQLMADAAAAGRGGQTLKIADEDAAYTYKAVGSELAGWFSAQPTFRVMELESGSEYAE